jgi:hypothetical protein
MLDVGAVVGAAPVIGCCAAAGLAGATLLKNPCNLLYISPIDAISLALNAPLLEATSIIVVKFFKSPSDYAFGSTSLAFAVGCAV